MGLTHELNQQPKQKQRIDMRLYKQRHCRFELKEAEKVGFHKMEPESYLVANLHYQEKERSTPKEI